MNATIDTRFSDPEAEPTPWADTEQALDAGRALLAHDRPRRRPPPRHPADRRLRRRSAALLHRPRRAEGAQPRALRPDRDHDREQHLGRGPRRRRRGPRATHQRRRDAPAPRRRLGGQVRQRLALRRRRRHVRRRPQPRRRLPDRGLQGHRLREGPARPDDVPLKTRPGGDTVSTGRDMDDNEEFILGESFATILTETTQSLVCVYDREARILLFNDACERATGYRREEVLGRDAREFVIPHEEREAFGDFLANVWRTGAPSPQVGHWRTKDGVAAADRLVEPPDGRRGRRAVHAGHHRDRPDRPRAAPCERRRRQGPAGRPGGQARRGLAAGERAAGAAARRHARGQGGQPRPRVHRGLGGVRAGAAGQHVGRAALRRRRHATVVGRTSRDSTDVFKIGETIVGAALERDRRGAQDRLARPLRRLGGGRRRRLPRRLPLVRRRADRRRRRALGRGHDRQREPAAARRRERASTPSPSSSRWPSRAPRRART